VPLARTSEGQSWQYALSRCSPAVRSRGSERGLPAGPVSRHQSTRTHGPISSNPDGRPGYGALKINSPTRSRHCRWVWRERTSIIDAPARSRLESRRWRLNERGPRTSCPSWLDWAAPAAVRRRARLRETRRRSKRLRSVGNYRRAPLGMHPRLRVEGGAEAAKNSLTLSSTSGLGAVPDR